MSKEYYVEFSEAAVDALKQGEWIVIEFENLCCKVIPYPIEEQMADEFNDKEVVFIPHLRSPHISTNSSP